MRFRRTSGRVGPAVRRFEALRFLLGLRTALLPLCPHRHGPHLLAPLSRRAVCGYRWPFVFSAPARAHGDVGAWVEGSWSLCGLWSPVMVMPGAETSGRVRTRPDH